VVGSDFDPYFLDWLFTKASEITAPRSTSPTASIHQSAAPAQPSSSRDAPRGTSRLLDTALAPLASQPEKRKFDVGGQDAQNKKRLSDGGGLPSGPRAMGGEGGRPRASRLGPDMRPRGSLPIRGMGPRGVQGNGGMGGHMGQSPRGQVCIKLIIPRFPTTTWVQTKRATSVPTACFGTWTAGDDGADDDDASEYDANGADDVKDGRGERVASFY
jgi:hypothetical protein